MYIYCIAFCHCENFCDDPVIHSQDLMGGPLGYRPPVFLVLNFTV